MNVSFKASIVNYATIIKKDKITQMESDYIGSFVELDKNNKDDYRALKDVASKWERGVSYAMDILDNFAFERSGKNIINNGKYRYFALTTNNKPFKKLKPESILGVASIIERDDKPFTLQHLQVHPEHTNLAENRGFRHIGESIAKSIQNLIKSNILNLYSSSDEATAFYKKMNFIKDKKSIYMIFKP